MRKTIGQISIVASAAVASAVLVSPMPAFANATVKAVLDNGETVQFTGSDSGARKNKVKGNVTFTVRSNGNWTMDSRTSNSLIAWRNVTWTCDLLFGPAHSTIRYTIGSHRVGGGDTKNRHAGAYDADIQEFFGEIRNRGEANCNISIG
ncbi:hypothetical protein ACGFNU_35940 [Spirillospora sp. NPDC048911]|uniref:hypothetical protein n=1 Tax=Spirillospora sp. NPDC048911 TaxID=3364527 RepID=UPI00371B0B06